MASEIITITIGDQSREVKISTPSASAFRESQKVRSKYFNTYLKEGYLLRLEVDQELKKRGLWSEEKEMEFKTLERQIMDAVKKLNEGGDFDECVDLAFQIKKWRQEQRDMLVSRAILDNDTAEGQADNMAFNYLISQCAVYNDTGERVFTGLDDYLSKSDEPYSYLIATKFSALQHGLGNKLEKSMPENQFLIEYGVLDEELRRVNNNGKLVDDDGRLINEDGYFIDENGNRIDIYGHKISDDGTPILEKKQFFKNGQLVEPKVKI